MATKTKAAKVEETPVTSDSLQLTPEEIKAILAIRERGLPVEVQEDLSSSVPEEQKFGLAELAQALTQALLAAQPPQKKTAATRKKANPWMPKDGSPKIMKLKRPMYHHGIPINPKTTFNEDCLLLDKIKPGVYCQGHVRVTKRKDGGLDIDYPIRTASQRLKLSSQFGITSFNGLLQRLIDERNDPRRYAKPEDLDDLD